MRGYLIDRNGLAVLKFKDAHLLTSGVEHLGAVRESDKPRQLHRGFFVGVGHLPHMRSRTYDSGCHQQGPGEQCDAQSHCPMGSFLAG